MTTMATRIAAYIMAERSYREGERDGASGLPLTIHPHFEATYPQSAQAYRDGWGEGARKREQEATMATTLRLKTDVDIDEAAERATFSIWLNNEAEAYTLRVERSDDDESPYVVRDGYTSDDNVYRSWADAVSAAWDFYTETQAQYFDQARGID